MEKLIKLILLSLIISSCGQNNGKFIYFKDNDPNLTEISEFTLLSSREYSPSNWVEDNLTHKGEYVYMVPTEVLLLTGNSGTGWMSLTMGNRKFCYQGNAQTVNDIGDKFILVKEKSDINESCLTQNLDISFNTQVTLKNNDQVKLRVDGGGCNNNCFFTEVEIDFVSEDN